MSETGSSSRSDAPKADAPKAGAPKARAELTDALKYTVADLRDESMLRLGIAPHDVAGAMYGCEPGATFTLDEAKARVEDYLTRPVS
jgi:hypothetical protein